MIGFFTITDVFAGQTIDQYLGRQTGFDTLLQNHLKNEHYGDDLKLLLISFIIEGQFKRDLPSKITASSFGKKDRAVEVKIPVKMREFVLFSESDRKKFIVESIIAAVNAARIRHGEKLDTDFDRLIQDVCTFGNHWLHSTPLSDNRNITQSVNTPQAPVLDGRSFSADEEAEPENKRLFFSPTVAC